MPAVLEPPTIREDTPASVPEAITPDAISHEAIELRAYFRYTHRGFMDGFALEDWLEAERELRQEANADGASHSAS